MCTLVNMPSNRRVAYKVVGLHRNYTTVSICSCYTWKIGRNIADGVCEPVLLSKRVNQGYFHCLANLTQAKIFMRDFINSNSDIVTYKVIKVKLLRDVYRGIHFSCSNGLDNKPAFIAKEVEWDGTFIEV